MLQLPHRDQQHLGYHIDKIALSANHVVAAAGRCLLSDVVVAGAADELRVGQLISGIWPSMLFRMIELATSNRQQATAKR